MDFSGDSSLPFDVKTVWAALHDTDLLAATIPGCRSMRATGDGNYVVAVSLGVAAVRGEYEGKAKLTDVKAPTHLRVTGAGSGAPGFVNVKADCYLEARGEHETFLRWNCDAQVGGLIASIGGRVLTGTSKYLAKQFFNVLTKELKKREGTVAGVMPIVSSSRINEGSASNGNWFFRLIRRLFRRTVS